MIHYNIWFNLRTDAEEKERLNTVQEFSAGFTWQAPSPDFNFLRTLETLPRLRCFAFKLSSSFAMMLSSQRRFLRKRLGVSTPGFTGA